MRTTNLTPNVVADCLVCGTHFERYVEPSKLASGKAKGIYCSRKCKGKALSRDKHPLWKGGRILEVDGYVMLHQPDHPHANNKGYVFEHRLVMEAHLGRILEPAEVVHHKNDVRSDNRIENLHLYPSNAEHKADDIVFRQRDQKGRLMPKDQPNAELFNEDCITGMERRIRSSTVDLTVTSIPFEEL